MSFFSFNPFANFSLVILKLTTRGFTVRSVFGATQNTLHSTKYSPRVPGRGLSVVLWTRSPWRRPAVWWTQC